MNLEIWISNVAILRMKRVAGIQFHNEPVLDLLAVLDKLLKLLLFCALESRYLFPENL